MQPRHIVWPPTYCTMVDGTVLSFPSKVNASLDGESDSSKVSQHGQ